MLARFHSDASISLRRRAALNSERWAASRSCMLFKWRRRGGAQRRGRRALAQRHCACSTNTQRVFRTSLCTRSQPQQSCVWHSRSAARGRGRLAHASERARRRRRRGGTLRGAHRSAVTKKSLWPLFHVSFFLSALPLLADTKSSLLCPRPGDRLLHTGQCWRCFWRLNRQLCCCQLP